MAGKVEMLAVLDRIKLIVGGMNASSDDMMEFGQKVAELRSLINETVRV